MASVNQILLVDKDLSSNTITNEKIKNAKLAGNVKVALNGGHALLYLEQINDKLVYSNLVILLTMDTPIMNGYEFLTSYNSCKNLNKDKILLVVLKENLTEEKINSLKSKGINHFIDKDFDPLLLEGIIKNHFVASPEELDNNAAKNKNKFKGNQYQSMNAA